MPVTFPSFPHVSRDPLNWITGEASGLFAQFAAIRRPSDVTTGHLALFNVICEPAVDFESLLSSSPNALSFLPPASWTKPLEEGVELEPCNHLLSNGRKPPDRKDFYARAKELYCDNEDAFSVLTSVPGLSQPAPCLARFRRFWEGLNSMAYYWDTTDLASKDAQANDRDLQAEVEATNVKEPRRKKAKRVTESSPEESPVPTHHVESIPAHTIHSGVSVPAQTQPPKAPWSSDKPAEPAERIPGTYRRIRLGNGAEMPHSFRLNTVGGFLEPIASAFGLMLVPHRHPPTLALGNIRFPVRMSAVAWREPADGMRVRAGWLEGPVMGVQCRPETGFGSTDSLEAESVLDVIRELGGMLLLSQERAREGKTKKKPGDGKWWVTRPRWGGPEGEVSKERRRVPAAEAWKLMRSKDGFWDPKVEYQAIGKSSGAVWDEIYMVSSLNHHISILKLRVHFLYVQFLTDGGLPKDLPKDASWASPTLQRTRWYDFFVIEDRAEAMRGLWGIMAYLMRQKENVDTTVKDS
ncbi:uncharacterized protein BDZ99DRAFT_428027 [Mytilinidion resinicola]|uniref:Uncharacterized protein n=1 Tax=Mytilinidion resinicola TaxID=574789 RepID=A0A6A6Y2I5_9PEZI|nr:uncharacterized protein BDZ99DRAFT_428027 [Mytilinidion resinicola]KAF2803021.1 hypothetical protein BDZ99DRAFT_428027 [Mytilinidion resinicola]